MKVKSLHQCPWFVFEITKRIYIKFGAEGATKSDWTNTVRDLNVSAEVKEPG
jgi:hypothetical protein